MKLKFIKKVTKEGKRKIVNIPKKYYNDIDVGDDVIIQKIDINKINFEDKE